MPVLHSTDGYANASQYHVTTMWLYGMCFYSCINDLYVASLKSELSLIYYCTLPIPYTLLLLLLVFTVSRMIRAATFILYALWKIRNTESCFLDPKGTGRCCHKYGVRRPAKEFGTKICRCKM